jgi:hypothetical protein
MKFRKCLQNRVSGSASMNVHGANAMQRGGSGHYAGAENPKGNDDIFCLMHFRHSTIERDFVIAEC